MSVGKNREFDRFTALVDKVISVPKATVQKRIEEEKRKAKQKPKRRGRSAKSWVTIMAQTFESYAQHYSSLPDDELLRLSQDVQSLMPDARTALRAEMERRNLSVTSVEWTAQPSISNEAIPEKTRSSSVGFGRFIRNFLILVACDVVYLVIIGGLLSSVHGIDTEAVAAGLTKALLELSVALAVIIAWRPLKLRPSGSLAQWDQQSPSDSC